MGIVNKLRVKIEDNESLGADVYKKTGGAEPIGYR